MTRTLIATAALCVSTAMTTATPANAQCLDCASTLQTAVIQGQVYRSSTEQRLREEDGRRRRSQSTAGVSAPSPDIMDRTQSVSFSVLNAEFSRRANAFGKGNAQQWLNGAARSVGGEMGRLRPEYLRRVSSQGRSQADNWYVGQARAVSQRYVANSGR